MKLSLVISVVVDCEVEAGDEGRSFIGLVGLKVAKLRYQCQYGRGNQTKLQKGNLKQVAKLLASHEVRTPFGLST